MLHDSRVTEKARIGKDRVWETCLVLELAIRSQWICPNALRELRLDVERNRDQCYNVGSPRCSKFHRRWLCDFRART